MSKSRRTKTGTAGADRGGGMNPRAKAARNRLKTMRQIEKGGIGYNRLQACKIRKHQDGTESMTCCIQGHAIMACAPERMKASFAYWAKKGRKAPPHVIENFLNLAADLLGLETDEALELFSPHGPPTAKAACEALKDDVEKRAEDSPPRPAEAGNPKTREA